MSPYMIFGALAVVGGSLGIGFKMGHDYASGRCDGKRLDDAMVATEVLNIKDGELEQCRAQVSAINATVAEQSRKIQNMIAADTRKREAAQTEAVQRDAELRAAQERVRDALTQLRSDINEGNFGVCAGESVPDDLISLLNDALAEGSDGP